jgi:hypothetical protein
VLRVVGEDLLVAAPDGVLLRSDPVLDPADLPCVSGRLGQLVPGEVLEVPGAEGWWKQLMYVCAAMPELWGSISQVDCMDPRAIMVYLRDGRHVVLWDPHRNDHLWDQVPLVLRQLRAGGLAGDAVLDMRFRDRIVVRVPEELLEPEEEPERNTAPPAMGSAGARRQGGDRA